MHVFLFCLAGLAYLQVGYQFQRHYEVSLDDGPLVAAGCLLCWPAIIGFFVLKMAVIMPDRWTRAALASRTPPAAPAELPAAHARKLRQ